MVIQKKVPYAIPLSYEYPYDVENFDEKILKSSDQCLYNLFKESNDLQVSFDYLKIYKAVTLKPPNYGYEIDNDSVCDSDNSTSVAHKSNNNYPHDEFSLSDDDLSNYVNGLNEDIMDNSEDSSNTIRVYDITDHNWARRKYIKNFIFGNGAGTDYYKYSNVIMMIIPKNIISKYT
jgi:hypothetical protein